MPEGWCKDERGHLHGFDVSLSGMAMVKLNSALQQLSGAIDGYVFKHYSYGIVVTRRPRMEGIKPSPAQLAQRERFRQAAKYHQTVLATPKAKKRCLKLAQKKGLPLAAVTMREFLRRPRPHQQTAES